MIEGIHDQQLALRVADATGGTLLVHKATTRGARIYGVVNDGTNRLVPLDNDAREHAHDEHAVAALLTAALKP